MVAVAFQRDPITNRVCDPDRGYHVTSQHLRDGTFIDVMKGGTQVLRLSCCSNNRPMTDDERRQHPEVRCPHVVIWHVAGPHRPEMDALATEVLTAFQSVNGIGCYIDGKPYDALVEVRLRSTFSRLY